jgi:hypothetical protein
MNLHTFKPFAELRAPLRALTVARLGVPVIFYGFSPELCEILRDRLNILVWDSSVETSESSDLGVKALWNSAWRR